MKIGLGLALLATSSLIGGCFNPSDPPAVDGGSTGPDDGATTTGGVVDDSTSDSPTTGPGPTSGEDACDPNPCQNGGTCADDDGGPSCECPPDFTGDLCETPVATPCDPDPCQNGTCTVNGDQAECECAPGWEGPLCGTNSDDCDPDPCQNGGVCLDQLDGFLCTCLDGFEGDACEIDSDDCDPNPCFNGQPCIDGVQSFECNCGPGFEGELCQCQVQGPFQIDYTNIGTFTTAQLFDNPPGVLVVGSNTINVLNLNGLGIVGGVSSNSIDTDEWIEFTFDQPSAATSYFVPSAGNQDLDGFVGECFVEAWDANNMSLGVVPSNGAGGYDLATLFGVATPVTRFRITADIDNLRVGSVTVSPTTCQ